MHDTLPDLLTDGLDVVFVGINPSCYSAQKGHYFARPTNRFWPCFSQSVLSEKARHILGVQRLLPEHDEALLTHGFGFTDVVKRATVRASDLSSEEFAAAVGGLIDRLQHYKPRIACFQGKTGYRHVRRHLAPTTSKLELGLQPVHIGSSQCYLVPNPAGVNAHFTRDDQTNWYNRLAEQL